MQYLVFTPIYYALTIYVLWFEGFRLINGLLILYFYINSLRPGDAYMRQ